MTPARVWKIGTSAISMIGSSVSATTSTTDPNAWTTLENDSITALPRATAPGLQVLVGDEWVDAVAPEGQVIINTGMMLERLTNGVIPTGIHRVVAAPGYSGERYSVVQFCHPTPWTLLTPLASCVTAEHPQRHSAMVSADALDMVLYEINLIETARRVG